MRKITLSGLLTITVLLLSTTLSYSQDVEVDANIIDGSLAIEDACPHEPCTANDVEFGNFLFGKSEWRFGR